MVEKPIYFGENHRIVVDTDANTYKLQFYNSADTIWYDIISYSTSDQAINLDPLLWKTSPILKLRGRETDGIEIQLQESGGDAIIYDATNAVTLFKLLRNTPIQFDIVLPIVFEKAIEDLPADSTGSKFTSKPVTPAMLNYAHYVALEAQWLSTHDDAREKIRIIADTDQIVVETAPGAGGYALKTDYKYVDAGKSLKVDALVSTASKTSGATFNLNRAVIYSRVSIV